MKEISISEMITYSTVLIRCKYSNNSFGSGTGFIMNLCYDKDSNQCIPVLITNNHVVKDSIETVFEFCKADNDGNPLDQEVFSFTYQGSNWVSHPEPQIDLCCLPIGAALNDIAKKGINIFYIPLETSMIATQEQLAELSAMEDIIMVGYPIGLSDTFNHKPIIRKGITATHPNKDYIGEKKILIDMPCFPGSSGSPVLILNQGTYVTPTGISIGNRILLLGILFGGPQYNAQGILSFANLPNAPRPIVQIPTNLGIAIKSEKILEFENLFRKME